MTTPQVNVPSDSKQKEADINQKTQLYGIYQAFALGKAPSNKQIDVALNSALASKALSNPSSKLSSDGKQLIADLRNVIEQSKLLFLTKNQGNLLQDFAWQCQQVGTGQASAPGLPVDKETAQQHGNEALEGLKTLGTLILTNGQFRKLLNDATVLARDIAGDAAQKAANKVNPDQAALDQLDEPAEDNVWHDKPDFKALKEDTLSKVKKNAPTDRDGLQSAANDAQNAASNRGNNTDSATAGARAGLDNLGSQVSANVPDETKEDVKEQARKAENRAREARERSLNYLKGKMPEERREQTVWRLKKMLVEIQGHDDYGRAIDTLLRLAEEYQGHTKNVTQQTTRAAQDAHVGNEGLKRAQTDLRTVLERFANNTSFDHLIEAIDQVYRDADQDPELKAFFRHLDAYIRKCLKQQGYVLEDQATEEWNKLYDQGNFLLRDRYKNHTNRVIDEIKFLGDQFDKDPQNRAFAQSMNKLFNDLGTDRSGKPEFKPHLLKDLRDVILPEILNGIRYIPLPDIEFTSTDADVVIRDLVVEADNIFPNMIEINSDNHFRFGRKGIKSTKKNKFAIHISGVQTHLTDIRFFAKSKKGLKMRNWGTMDIALAKTGLDFKIKLETADASDGAHFFKVTDVDVKISNFNLKFKNQHHPILTGIASLVAKGPAIQGPLKKVLEAKIKEAVNDFDAFAYQIHSDVNKAKESAKNDPENADGIFKQYFDAYKSRALRRKEEAEKKAKEAKRKAEEKEVKMNIAWTRDQRISTGWYSGTGVPIDIQERDPKATSGRFTLKSQEYRDLARSGSKWESPVFGIGSARESSTLPAAGTVQRKEHEVTPATLTDKNGNQVSGASGAGTSGAGSTSLSNGAANSTTGATGVKTNGTTLGTTNPVLTGQV